MSDLIFNPGTSLIIERENFDELIEALKRRGYQPLSPRMRDGSIVYDGLTSSRDLPIGWTDEQRNGSYRLKKTSEPLLFGYAVGPHAWKQFLHPPVAQLVKARKDANSITFTSEFAPPPRQAFIGVRGCELQAIAIQDKVLTGGKYPDPIYKSQRENLFIVAVNCGQARGTCFCLSMGAGPKVAAGFDIALTEVFENGRHYFVAEIGTPRGAEIMCHIRHKSATEAEQESAERLVTGAASEMGRILQTEGLKELLYRSHEHPQWEVIAKQCLSCGNCTMVCPTCFCTTVEDVTDLAGTQAERRRKWDSCFTSDFTYIHGGSVRASNKSRYRHWMLHKLATWQDQFGSFGCVGCGRCITWCPAGIDLTEQARIIRQSDGIDLSQENIDINLEDFVAECSVFRGFDPAMINLIAGCASNVRFNAGEYMFRQGDPSNKFYILRSGKASLEISVLGQGPLLIQTLQEGEIVGWSSMVRGLRRNFDVRALELTRAFAFDGRAIRQRCEENPKLGYELLKLFTDVIGRRLQATRLQLLDLYAPDH